MKIYALLSWYNEKPEHLRRCVTSLKGFADVIVALDGAYGTFPDARRESPAEQRFALNDAAIEAGLSYALKTPHQAWRGGEVEKRAVLFRLGREAGATPDDWFLIIDADMALTYFAPDVKEALANVDPDVDVAEVRLQNVRVDGTISANHKFRSLFRALPGLTVERAHYLYTVPDDSGHFTGRRFLWHMPNGQLSCEPTFNLYGDITLQHFNAHRDPDRKRQALSYYKARDAAGLEAVGDWR